MFDKQEQNEVMVIHKYAIHYRETNSLRMIYAFQGIAVKPKFNSPYDKE